MTHHLTATASSIQPAAARRSYLVAAYRAARSTAMWFAGLLGNDGLVCHGGITIPGMTKEQTWQHSLYWLNYLEELWLSHPDVHDALGLCGTIGCENATFAKSADSQAATSCLCPACTLLAMQARREEVERKQSND